jgi:hypothetical protein
LVFGFLSDLGFYFGFLRDIIFLVFQRTFILKLKKRS